MIPRSVLISIQPVHVAKILSGEKRLEFRRLWAAQPVDCMVIYATCPQQKIIATAQIKRTITGTATQLWAAAQELGGGISRSQLFDYFKGKPIGTALELTRIRIFDDAIDPIDIFGQPFHPPQSFRYMKRIEEDRLDALLKRRP